MFALPLRVFQFWFVFSPTTIPSVSVGLETVAKDIFVEKLTQNLIASWLFAVVVGWFLFLFFFFLILHLTHCHTAFTHVPHFSGNVDGWWSWEVATVSVKNKYFALFCLLSYPEGLECSQKLYEWLLLSSFFVRTWTRGTIYRYFPPV